MKNVRTHSLSSEIAKTLLKDESYWIQTGACESVSMPKTSILREVPGHSVHFLKPE